MSARIRFADAADVYAAFPGLARISAPPSGAAAPLDHARALIAAPLPVGALAFIAHLLPRREAVWWGCQCVVALSAGAEQEEGMRLARHWVRDPDEPKRRAALAHVQACDLKTPSDWLARAVAFSGGSLWPPDQPNQPASQEACAASVHAALTIATTTQPPLLILPWMRACAEAGVRFADGGEAKVEPPTQPRK